MVHGFGESNAHANHDAGFDGGVGAAVFGTQSGGKSGQKLLSFSAKETIDRNDKGRKGATTGFASWGVFLFLGIFLSEENSCWVSDVMTGTV